MMAQMRSLFTEEKCINVSLDFDVQNIDNWLLARELGILLCVLHGLGY